MIDLIYIDPSSNTMVSFQVEGVGFAECYKSVRDSEKVATLLYEQYAPLIKAFGLSIEIPSVFGEVLDDKAQDRLLRLLAFDVETLLEKYIYIAVPEHLTRLFTDNTTLHCYQTLGINTNAVLLTREDDEQSYLAAASYEEMKTEFKQLGDPRCQILSL